MGTVLVDRKRLVGADTPTPRWPRPAVRIGFGLIWLIDAVFKWLPDFHKGIVGMVQGAADGQPSWLHGWFHFWISAVQANPNFWAYGIAALETVLALAIILGFARKVTYLVTIFTALFIWGIAEGFGGPYSGTSTDIGAAVMYAVVALAMLTLSLQLGPDRYSVDYWLEQRVSWWHKVAELGAHNHPVPSENGSAALTPVVLTATTSPDAPADGNGSVTHATPVMLMATGSSDENGSAGPATPVVLLEATSDKNGTVTLTVPEVAAASASPENGVDENGAGSGSAGLATPVVVPPRSSPDSSPDDESAPLTPSVVPVAS